MREHSSADMEKGLYCYDPETRVFPKIMGKIAEGRGLNKRGALRILKWKLGRTKSDYSKTVAADKMVAINEAVANAGKAERKVEALEALDKIPGVATWTGSIMHCRSNAASCVRG